MHGLIIGQINQGFVNNGIFITKPHELAAIGQFMWHFNTIFQLFMNRICLLFWHALEVDLCITNENYNYMKKIEY